MSNVWPDTPSTNTPAGPTLGSIANGSASFGWPAFSPASVTGQFVAPLNGSTVSSVRPRASQFDPSDPYYGAAGNGVTDDTTPVLAAYADAKAQGGGTVLFRPGAYLLSQPLSGVYGVTGAATAAPSLVSAQAGGHIGDVGYPTEKSAVSLVASGTFPLGSFLVDYQAGGVGKGGALGFIVNGLTLECQSRAAGFRAQGPRECRGQDLTVSHPWTPVSPGDGSSAGFNVTFNGNQTAGAWNHWEHITVSYPYGDCFYHNHPGQDVFIGCHAIQAGQNAANSYNYRLGTASQATWMGCDQQAGTNQAGGWYIKGSIALLIGCGTEPGTSGPPGNAVRLGGETAQTNSTLVKITFIGCQFINSPAASPGEEAGALIVAEFNAGRPQSALFDGCTFATTANTTDFAYAEASNTGLIEFYNSSFQGPVATQNFNDASGNNIFRYRNCNGINPVGVVTPVVPASGTPVAAQPYDRTFYVSTVAGTTSCSIALASGPTIPFVASTAQVVSVRVPAGIAPTPTYTGTAPTWVVEGE